MGAERGEGVGNIYAAKSEPGREFSPEDEETLVMFASQAALVIANARRHREEQRTTCALSGGRGAPPAPSDICFTVRGLLLSRELRR